MPPINSFDKGLFLSSPADAIPEGGTISNRGLSVSAVRSFKSRYGSVQISTLDAHSAIYFADQWFFGASTSLYRAATEIITGLSGDKLSLAIAPPTSGVTDYLFLAGGDTLYKVDSAGNESNWGIAPPASDPTAALAAGGSLTDGSVYQYKITYTNSTTGTRSNSNDNAVSATPSGANLSITLSAIPDGSLVDAQIDQVEIWRTVADGAVFFLLDTIAAGTTTYTDDGSVSLASTELPTDNLKPFGYLDDCLGPFNASMFWITRTQAGQSGRLFYSPIGRLEAIAGFIEITNDTNPLQKIFRIQGQIGVIAESGIFLVGGQNPYVAREVKNCPGTTEPHSVVETPAGLVYRAADGLRLFDGSRSYIFAPDTVEPVFIGESKGDLSNFGTTQASRFRENEYIISDGTQTIAFDIKHSRFRDIGIGLSAFYYASEIDTLAANFSNAMVSLEVVGEYDDNGTAIPVIIEPHHFTSSIDSEQLLQYLIFDINLAGESLAGTLTIDGTAISIGTLQNAARGKITVPIGRKGKFFSIQLTGSLSAAQIELFDILPIFYAPGR